MHPPPFLSPSNKLKDFKKSIKKSEIKISKKSIEENNASLPVPKNQWDDKGLKRVLLSNHGIWSDIKIVQKSCEGLSPKYLKLLHKLF